MTTPSKPDNLEHDLSRLTQWRGEEPNLWQKSLGACAADPKPAPKRTFDGILRKPLSNSMMLTVVGCFALVVVVMVGLLLPSLGKARNSTRTLGSASAPHALHQGQAHWAQKGVYGETLAAASPRATSVELNGGLPVQDAQEFDRRASGSVESTDRASRSVIQKANIDLQTDDVRAAFANATHLISSAGGEFVENSSLTGDGKTAQANLTLRVGVARLSDVMNQLRELGKVHSEKTTGEDVTSQVVDLEARLRNEQRIEKELLELLDRRADAPLKDILELRNSLSSVRQTIEQYIAQRDRLGRLVSLASILVVIRAEPEATPKPEPAQSISAYFVNTISDTWHSGLRAASDSVSWLLSLLISGILWWLALAAILYSILRYRRRLAARCV